MKEYPLKKFLLVYFLLLLFSSSLLFPQSKYRFFDSAEPLSKYVRLTIFHPSEGIIRSIAELKNNEIVTLKNLLVVAVFHEKEQYDYKKSIDFIKQNNIDWVKFHKLTKNIYSYNLFQENSLSDEFKNIFTKSDGIIFFGGADIPPYIYNEKTNLLTSIRTPYRHFVELSFIFHLLGGFQNNDFKPFLDSAPQFAVLGICLGEQSLNVGTGGTLVQDIFSEIYGKTYLEDIITMSRENWHRNPLVWLYPEKKLLSYSMHRIRLKENSKFVSEMGFNKEDTPFVLSSHHQMVNKLGKKFKVSATSLDGKVIEAIEHEKYPNVLGIQFHPESSLLWDPEQTFKFTLKQKKEISLRSILDNNPPSFAFHKKLWSWFCEKLDEYHKSKQ